MNKIVKDTVIKQDSRCKDVQDITYENCHFDHLVFSDLKFERVTFFRCKFSHVFIESFFAKDVSIISSEIFSLSLRGDRKITSKKLFSRIEKKIHSLTFENTKIEELLLGGNLQVINCVFPKGENYLHIRNPFKVYTKCKNIIESDWQGEKKRIGLIHIQTFLNKGVENQNEDFVTYSDNNFIEENINEILKSVFSLIKEVNS
ncbi:MAG: hypothetical protein KF763_15580 [Cyclobacteriaceae bacterium]|nr:hypothetical protein [Cyclobacteriaceae bacterium]